MKTTLNLETQISLQLKRFLRLSGKVIGWVNEVENGDIFAARGAYIGAVQRINRFEDRIMGDVSCDINQLLTYLDLTGFLREYVVTKYREAIGGEVQ